MRDMAAVRNNLLTHQQQQALEERIRVCLALSDNFNDAIQNQNFDSLRDILLHQIASLPELDAGAVGLPATLVTDIEMTLMQRIDKVMSAIHLYQSTRIV